MKIKLLLLFFLPLLLGGCSGGLYSATLISSGQHTFSAGEQISGDLFLRAGSAHFEPQSRVSGSLYILGGTLSLAGHVEGDLVLLGGRLTLEPTARIEGDLRLGGGEIDQDSSALVQGRTIHGRIIPIADDLPVPRTEGTNWLGLFMPALTLAALGAFLARGRSPGLNIVSDAVTENTLVSGAMGLLLLILLPSLLVLMTFTIFLIPLAVLLGLLFIFILGYGFIALGCQVGLWLGHSFGRDPGPGWAAFGGTLLLMLLFHLPLVGSILLAITADVVIGAIFLTRLATQPFRPAGAMLDHNQSQSVYERPSLPGDSKEL